MMKHWRSEAFYDVFPQTPRSPLPEMGSNNAIDPEANRDNGMQRKTPIL